MPNLMADFNGFTGAHCIKCQNSVFSTCIYLNSFFQFQRIYSGPDTLIINSCTSDWFINNEIGWDVHVHVHVAWTWATLWNCIYHSKFTCDIKYHWQYPDELPVTDKYIVNI